MRVLVVDDDELDRETCRRVLEADAWEVLEAETHDEALAALDKGTKLDVVLSDYDLKDAKNGIDVLTRARHVQPGAKRLLMSGLLPPNVLEGALDDGCVQGYIEKPDTLDEWHEAMEAALPQKIAVRAGGNTAEPGATVQPTRVDRPPAGGSGTAMRGVAAATNNRHPATREQALEERVRLFSAVVDLGADAHSGASLKETFDRAVRLVSRTLDMEYTKILELLPGGKEVLLVAGVGWKPGLVGNAKVSTGMDSQAGYTLASEHPVIAEDLRAETRFSGPSLLHEHEVVSGLSVVIPGEGGRPWGVFGAHTKKRRVLTEDHALFLRAIANVVAGAIARARTEDTLRNTQEVLEREVTERTRELRAAVDDLQAFNAMVAHDLRAPLRTVRRSVDIFLREHGADLDPDARKILDIAEKATRQMRTLLEDLLALAKATQDPVHMEDVDVTALARERWKQVAQREPDRDVHFVVEDGLEAHADPRLLAVVLDNLLENGLKFTRGVPSATVEVGAKHLPVGGTAYYVRDNGAGFAPTHAAQLFHPFKRLHSAKEFEGTGIGLATVRRIVERHQGRVWAESPGPAKGATFYFRLLPSGLP